MAVIAHVVLPGVTKEQYDQVRAEMQVTFHAAHAVYVPRAAKITV